MKPFQNCDQTVVLLDAAASATYVRANRCAYIVWVQSSEPRDVVMATTQVTDASFEAEVLKSDAPVVVDFWAEWCGPCKMIAPALEEISEEMGDNVKITKLNIDENQDVAMKYGIRSIPMLILFKDGEPMATQVGAAPKGKLG